MIDIQDCISVIIHYSNKMLALVKEDKDRLVEICADIFDKYPEISEGVVAECDARPRDSYLRENLVAMGFLRKIFSGIEHDNLIKLTKLTISGNAWNCCARQPIKDELFEKFFYFKYSRDFISTFSRILGDDHFLFFDCISEILMAEDIVAGATLKTKIFLETELIEIKIFFGETTTFDERQDEKKQKILGIVPGMVRDKKVHDSLIKLCKTFFVVNEDYIDHVEENFFHEYFAWMQESYWYGDLALSPRSTKEDVVSFIINEELFHDPIYGCDNRLCVGPIAPSKYLGLNFIKVTASLGELPKSTLVSVRNFFATNLPDLKQAFFYLIFSKFPEEGHAEICLYAERLSLEEYRVSAILSWEIEIKVQKIRLEISYGYEDFRFNEYGVQAYFEAESWSAPEHFNNKYKPWPKLE